jgi:uncharacterized delta-60 repeat protein
LDTNYIWSLYYDHQVGSISGQTSGFTSTFRIFKPQPIGTPDYTDYTPYTMYEVSQDDYNNDGCIDWTYDPVRNYVYSYTGSAYPQYCLATFWESTGYTGANVFADCATFSGVASTYGIRVGSSTYFGPVVTPTPTPTPSITPTPTPTPTSSMVGTLVLTYDEYPDGIDFPLFYARINGADVYNRYIDSYELATIALRQGDTMRLQIYTPNYNIYLDVIRRDFTDDGSLGPNGIYDTFVTGVTGDTNTYIEFTIPNLPQDYNFEYRLNCGIVSPVPKPTPTPTPTPIPFIISTGADNEVDDIIVDYLDNVYIGGNFFHYDERTTDFPYDTANITKVNPNGGVKSTYREMGWLNYGPEQGLSKFNKLLFTQDDKVIAGGRFDQWEASGYTYEYYNARNILELNQNERTYYRGYPIAIDINGSGINGFNNMVNDIAQQPADGKFIIVGDFTSYSSTTKNGIIRITTGGTVDTSFVIGSGFTMDFGYDFSVKCVEIQSDGKILIGGYFYKYNGYTSRGIIRLNADGTRDTTFTSNFNSLFTSAGYYVNVIRVDAGGKILVGGNFGSTLGSIFSGYSSNGIIRLNFDGTLDTTFTTSSGFTYYDGVTSIPGEVNDILIQPNSNILVGGKFNKLNGVTQSCITRLTTYGLKDTEFNSGSGFAFSGVTTVPYVKTLALQSTNNIMVGGYFDSYNGTFPYRNVIRLSPNGSNNTVYVPLPVICRKYQITTNPSITIRYVDCNSNFVVETVVYPGKQICADKDSIEYLSGSGYWTDIGTC